MPTFASPKVVFTEVDRSMYTPNLAAVTAVFITLAKRGSVDPKFVGSASLYRELYMYDNSVDSLIPTHNPIIDYLAADGAGAYIIRAVPNDAAYAGVVIKKSDAADTSPVQVSSLTDPNAYVFGPDDLFLIAADNPGNWGNNIVVSIKPSEQTDVFVIEVTFGDDFERFEASTQPGKKDGWGNSIFLPDAVSRATNLIQVRVNPAYSDGTLPAYGDDISLGGGVDGSVVSEADILAAAEKISNPEEYSIDLLVQGGLPYTSLAVKFGTIAEDRKDCVALLDCPIEADTVPELIDYRKNTLALGSSYAALFAPWIRSIDDQNGAEIVLPPSSTVAKLIANVDRYFNPWVSPAGLKRGNVKALGLTAYFGEADQDQLSPNSINIFRRFPGTYVLWDDKTLLPYTSALSILPIRRCLIKIRKELTVTAKGFMFDPLTEDLRKDFVGTVEDYLHAIQRDGGLREFLVKCDPLGDENGNNPPNKVDQGILTCDIFLKPVGSLRGVSINGIITRTGVDFKEIAG